MSSDKYILHVSEENSYYINSIRLLIINTYFIYQIGGGGGEVKFNDSCTIYAIIF